MNDSQVNAIVKKISEQLSKSLWLVYKLAVEGELRGLGGTRKRARTASGAGATTRAIAATKIIRTAAEAARRGRAKESHVSDSDWEYDAD